MLIETAASPALVVLDRGPVRPGWRAACDDKGPWMDSFPRLLRTHGGVTISDVDSGAFVRLFVLPFYYGSA